jgi:hypothetical protein
MREKNEEKSTGAAHKIDSVNGCVHLCDFRSCLNGKEKGENSGVSGFHNWNKNGRGKCLIDAKKGITLDVGKRKLEFQGRLQDRSST